MEEINFKRYTYFERIKKSYKVWNRFLYTLGFFVFVTLPFLYMTYQYPILFLITILSFLLFFIAPVVFSECKNYIFQMKVTNDQIVIKYLSFNKEKEISEEYIDLRLLSQGNVPSSKTVENFKIYRDYGKGHRRYLVNQYKILEWSKPENIEKLEQLLNKSKRIVN